MPWRRELEMSGKLKVLFAGLGSIGQRHVRNLRALLGDQVEILAYRQRRSSLVLNPDMTVRAGADLETIYGIRTFVKLEDALEERPTAVFVTNPNVLHVPVALAAARAGCHLFIEKPISHSLDGVDELIDLVERQGLIAFVAYQFRFHPGLQLLKSMLSENRLGRLSAAHIVNGEYLPDWHPYEDYSKTHPASREMGGGCLRIQTHELDYALWLFGMPRRVFAVGGHLSRLDVDVEDSVSLLLECRDGDLPFPVHVHLDFLQRPPQRVCEIVGDTGKVLYDYHTNTVKHHSTEPRAETLHRFDGFDRNQMFLDELKHFLDCLKGEAAPIVTLRQGRSSMRIAQGALESLETGRSVELN